MPARSSGRKSAWDPWLIISQILALQACHYLLLSVITPPMLYLFSNPVSLSLEGGASNVGMILDWRQMAGKGTIEEQIGDYTQLPPAMAGQAGMGVDQAGGRPNVEYRGVPIKPLLKGNAPSREPEAQARPLTEEEIEEQLALLQSAERDGHPKVRAADPVRGYTIALAWLAASCLDVGYLYTLIRRPTHILDFSLTMVIIHTILTSYYATAFPTSLFFWVVITFSAGVQVVWAEQLCVRREMQEGFQLGQGWKSGERSDDDSILPTSRKQRRNSAPSAVGRPSPYDRIPMVEIGP